MRKITKSIRRMLAMLLCVVVVVGTVPVNVFASDEVFELESFSFESSYAVAQNSDADAFVNCDESISVDEEFYADGVYIVFDAEDPTQMLDASECGEILEYIQTVENFDAIQPEVVPVEENDSEYAEAEETVEVIPEDAFDEVEETGEVIEDASEEETGEVIEDASEEETGEVIEDASEEETDEEIEEVSEEIEEVILDEETADETGSNDADSDTTSDDTSDVANVEETSDSIVEDNNVNIDSANLHEGAPKQETKVSGESEGISQGDAAPGDLTEWYLVPGETQSGVENKPKTTVLKETLGNGLNYIIAGVTDGLKEQIGYALTEIMDRAGNTPLALIANSLIDAEKYSVDYDGYDSKQCWIGAASTNLWLSGWASYLGFKNEDEVMTYMTKAFTDEAASQPVAWRWLFDGMYGGTAATKLKESTSVPMATSLCIPAAIGPNIEAKGKLTELSVVEQLKERSVAMSIGWANAEGTAISAGKHAVTALGVVFDDTATDPKDRYKAIILADPDDDGGSYTTAPESDADAYEKKKASKNKYNVYKLGTEVVGGVTYWTINDYTTGEKTYIMGFDTLENFSPEVLDKITEKPGEGTKDIKTTSDLTLGSSALWTFNGTGYVEKSEFCGEEVELWVDFENTSYTPIAAGITVPVEVEVINKTTNQSVKKVIYGVSHGGAGAFEFGSISLSLQSALLEMTGAGDYEVIAKVNPAGQGGLKEAYYANNPVIRKTFKILPSNGGPGDIPGEEPGDEPSVEPGVEPGVEPAVTPQGAEPSGNSTNSVSAEVLQVGTADADSVETAELLALVEKMFTEGTACHYAPVTKLDLTKNSSLGVYIKGCKDNLIKVEIDGVEISKEQYSAIQKSDNIYKVSILSAIVKNLSKGTHKIRLTFNNGTEPVEFSFEVF